MLLVSQLTGVRVMSAAAMRDALRAVWRQRDSDVNGTLARYKRCLLRVRQSRQQTTNFVVKIKVIKYETSGVN